MPALDKASQQSRGEAHEAPPGAEELLATSGCWKGQSHFSCTVWPLGGCECPVGGPRTVCIWATLTGVSRLFLERTAERRHEVRRRRGHSGEAHDQNELGVESGMGEVKIHWIYV